MQNTISSKKAALVLNVNESTVKRWADSNILKCIKTAGGHRRFFLEDIRKHAVVNDLKTSFLSPYKVKLNVRRQIQKREYKALSKILEHILLEGDIAGSYNLLVILYFNSYKLEDIFDSIVRTAMKSIGDQWNRGILKIENEHIASNALISSLHQLEKSINSGKVNGMTAVCTGMEREGHGIGLLCVKIILQQMGYKVVYPGIDLPLRSLSHLLYEYHPSIVCLSTSFNEDDEKLSEEIRTLKNKCEKDGILVFVGGQNINPSKNKSAIIFCNNITELVNKLKNEQSEH